ncbi:MAG: hypothetical protein K1X67_19425 [Fimbriimonadaceae bacterium]|nr:hypothetical protein [Fimbriimonadaceae bacterium]
MRNWNRLSLLAVAGLSVGLIGCGGENTGPFSRRVFGEEAYVNGQKVETWETTDLQGNVVEVGFSITETLIDNPPAGMGSGPAGAFATLKFPPATRSQTFLNHFELHWNTMGHEPPVYMKPHWDFHFYGVSPEDVFNALPPDPGNPLDGQIPPGYAYPGPEALVPEMGVHAAPFSDFAPGYDFEHTFIYGYYGGKTTFIEPMVTQEFLQRKQGYQLNIPQPQILGRSTRFPTRLIARWMNSARKWEFVLTDFVNKN